MGQLVGCIRGIGEVSRALDFPIVSGNVSLYNETNGRAILPTPTIGGVGLLDDFTKSMTLAFKAAGEAILLIGDTRGWLGQSLYLRDICGREEGAPPPVDLAAERRHGDFIRGLIRKAWRQPCTAFPRRPPGRACRNGDGLWHRRRTGGPGGASRPRLLVRGGSGALRRHDKAGRDDHAESAGRSGADQSPRATGGRALAVANERPLPVDNLVKRFESWLLAYMATPA